MTANASSVSGERIVQAPRVKSRHVELRPVSPDYYQFLYRLHVEDEVGFRWRFHGETPSPEIFIARLWEGVIAQFVVVEAEKGEGIALVTTYGVNLRDQHGHIALVTAPKYLGTGFALEGLALFVEYLFQLWPLRKLYAESVEYNYSQFARGANRYFSEEGILRQQEYYAERFWDVHVLALYRRDWERIRGLMYRTVLGEKAPVPSSTG